MGVIEVVDIDAGRRALAAGALRCPCGGRLRAWGHARTRTVRHLAGAHERVCPDRARCRSCQVTHVVRPAGVLPGRGYGIDVIGAALLGVARGQGHRSLAARLDVPAATVRSWLRRARSNSEALRRLGVQTVVDLEPELLPTRVGPTRLGEALEALAAAALAVVRRFGGNERDLWPVICVITRSRLLAPTLSP
jgi:transposase-like protein